MVLRPVRFRLIQSVPMAGTLPLRMFYTKRSCVSMRLLACYTHSISHHLLVEVIHAQVLHGKTIFGLAALVVLAVAEPWCPSCGSATPRGLSSSSISRLSLLLLLLLLLLFCFGRRTQSCSKTSSQAHTTLAQTKLVATCMHCQRLVRTAPSLTWHELATSAQTQGAAASSRTLGSTQSKLSAVVDPIQHACM